MLPVEAILTDCLTPYPQELRAELRQMIMDLIVRDRQYWVSELQCVLSGDIPPAEFRHEVDRILLEALRES